MHRWKPTAFADKSQRIPIEFACVCGVKKIIQKAGIGKSYTHYVTLAGASVRSAPACTGGAGAALT